MIPEGVTLYTWVDVEEVLLRARDVGSWPDGLIEASSYWNELSLRVRPGAEAAVQDWAHDTFAPRFLAKESAIELENNGGEQPRRLPVRVEPTDEEKREVRRRPSFARPRRLWGTNAQLA